MGKRISRTHRLFRRWEPYVGLLAATGFFTWLGKKLKVFGDLGWPEAIFLGLVAGFITALSLAAWRYYRPLPSIFDPKAQDIAAQILPHPEIGAPPKVTTISLPTPEKERVSKALLAALDYLDRFADFAQPVRKVGSWQQILGLSGTMGVVETVEIARARSREFATHLAEGIGPHATELELAGVDGKAIEESIEKQAAVFETLLHSIGSIAATMKPEEPNEAALSFVGQIFTSAFSQFEGAITVAKEQITEARRRLAQGDLG